MLSIRHNGEFIFKIVALKEAGVLTERLKFEKSDDKSGTGISVWNWSDGIMSCGGEYSFTAIQVEE